MSVAIPATGLKPPASTETYPLVRHPDVPMAVGFPMPGDPDMPATQPVPESTNPDISRCGRVAGNFLIRRWRGHHHDTLRVIDFRTRLRLRGRGWWRINDRSGRCHHTAAKPCSHSGYRQQRAQSNHLDCTHNISKKCCYADPTADRSQAATGFTAIYPALPGGNNILVQALLSQRLQAPCAITQGRAG
jgi:hypothetical protein